MSNKRNSILFLNLYAFSLTGGVEKVSRNFVLTLNKLFSQKSWSCFSLYDNDKDVDFNYPLDTYKAFNGYKFEFVLKSCLQAIKTNTLVLSHINLLIVARLVTFFKPRLRIVLIAHGIEVWHELPKWKVSFIKKHVEIWAVSEFTKKVLIKKHGISTENIMILHNCISPSLHLPTTFDKPKNLLSRYNFNDNVPILYTLTRISSTEKYKGYDKVIKALAILKAKGEQFNYILGGRADKNEEIRINELITSYGLQNNIKLLGFISDAELTEHFLLADIFIMPSKKEGFGIVFIEAAAHGCLVIAGNKDGSVDALLHGKLGLLVDPDSEEDIVIAIEQAINNKKHQPTIQQQLTIENFGFEQYLEKVEELIKTPVISTKSSDYEK